MYKEIKMKSFVYKVQRYGQSPALCVNRDSGPDIFMSNVNVVSDTSTVKIKIIFEGHPSNVPPELLETLLCTSDSSYNPSRPFRWYKTTGFKQECAITTDPENIIECRNAAFSTFLHEIDTPEKIWIYEMYLL